MSKISVLKLKIYKRDLYSINSRIEVFIMCFKSKLLFFFLFILLVLFAFSFQFFEFYKLEENVNSYVAVTIDGTYSTKVPEKNSGKAIESIVCDKDAIGVWDYDNWNLNIKNMKETRTRCQLNFVTEYSESILNGTDPVLKEGLIPVTIEDNGTVHKASLGSKWYSYQEKQWANAVILLDNTQVYADGETIPESNIESYFVWIPRYRYKIFNDGNYPSQNQELLVDNKLPNKAQEIEVVFENKNTSVSNGNTVGSWLTHPAFTSFDVNGMWVGKFETGYKGSTDMASAQKNVVEPGSVQIKPNVNSWRGIQVANAFYTSYDYKREMNSHMMKNTEWGSVAYLQHSKYGSMQSVRFNNNSANITGYAAVNEPTCNSFGKFEDCNKFGTESSITQLYNTLVGYLASTTGNISGVYDMSGGTIEYMMGVMLDQEGKPMSGRNSKSNSGFNGSFGCPTCDGDTSGIAKLTTGKVFPTDTRYYDSYPFSSADNSYNQRSLGDAMGEMGPFATLDNGRFIGSWYGDEAWALFYANPWVIRGGFYNSGTGSGIFNFGRTYGNEATTFTFRIVLSM